ncbi:MAG TPA: hypothetical protein VES67_17300 [Vicinamibacterales bacterium]|nr:hypothetical protein [Vicinamibacterales bacterium]
MERPSRVRLTAVAIAPPGPEADPERSELDSSDPDGTARLPDTTPPGCTGADRGADRSLPFRDGLEVGMRLGDRETLEPSEPEDELEPPLPEPEPELVEPELPPELDPEDPELEEPDDVPRGTACAPARLGAASANETTRLSARRVDLAMVVLPRSCQGPLQTA